MVAPRAHDKMWISGLGHVGGGVAAMAAGVLITVSLSCHCDSDVK